MSGRDGFGADAGPESHQIGAVARETRIGTVVPGSRDAITRSPVKNRPGAGTCCRAAPARRGSRSASANRTAAQKPRQTRSHRSESSQRTTRTARPRDRSDTNAAIATLKRCLSWPQRLSQEGRQCCTRCHGCALVLVLTTLRNCPASAWDVRMSSRVVQCCHGTPCTRTSDASSLYLCLFSRTAYARHRLRRSRARSRATWRPRARRRAGEVLAT